MESILGQLQQRLKGIEMIHSIHAQAEDFDTLLSQLEHDVSVIRAYLDSEVKRCDSVETLLNEFEYFKQILDAMAEIEVKQMPETVVEETVAPFLMPKKPTQLPHLTEKQLKNLPRYLITMAINQKSVAKLNAKIDIMNKLFSQKESITQEDLKLNGWIWDTIGKSLIQILRHLKLLQETRSNSKVVYKLQ